LLVGSTGLALAAGGLYWTLQHAVGHFTLAFAISGLLVGVTGAIPSLMVNLFPAPIRFSGISFSYNVAYAICGGLTPLAVTLWLRAGEAYAPVYYVAAACLAGALAILIARSAPSRILATE
jgi:hypothetical protein